MPASFNFGDAVLRLTSNDSQMNKGLQRAEQRATLHAHKMTTGMQAMHTKMGASADKFFARIEAGAKRAGAAMAKIGAGAAIAGGAGAVGMLKLGADAVESENLFSKSLAGMEARARKWSETYSRSLRLNEFETRKNLGTLQNFLTNMSMAPETAFSWSKALTTLTNDLSSFYNISRESAFEKIMSGVSGNSVEPLRALGINLSETQKKLYAVRTGMVDMGGAGAKLKQKLAELDKQQAAATARFEKYRPGKHDNNARERVMAYDAELKSFAARREALLSEKDAQENLNFELTETQKLQAGLGLFWERSRAAQGDLADTLNSPLNVLRGIRDELKGSLTNISQKFLAEGTPLNNMLVRIATWADKIANRLNAWADSNGPAILQTKLEQLWTVAAAKMKAVHDRFVEFSKDLQDFWGLNKDWLKPLLITGAIAAGTWALGKAFGGGGNGENDSELSLDRYLGNGSPVLNALNRMNDGARATSIGKLAFGGALAGLGMGAWSKATAAGDSSVQLGSGSISKFNNLDRISMLMGTPSDEIMRRKANRAQEQAAQAAKSAPASIPYLGPPGTSPADITRMRGIEKAMREQGYSGADIARALGYTVTGNASGGQSAGAPAAAGEQAKTVNDVMAGISLRSNLSIRPGASFSEILNSRWGGVPRRHRPMFSDKRRSMWAEIAAGRHADSRGGWANISPNRQRYRPGNARQQAENNPDAGKTNAQIASEIQIDRQAKANARELAKLLRPAKGLFMLELAGTEWGGMSGA